MEQISLAIAQNMRLLVHIGKSDRLNVLPHSVQIIVLARELLRQCQALLRVHHFQNYTSSSAGGWFSLGKRKESIDNITVADEGRFSA